VLIPNGRGISCNVTTGSLTLRFEGQLDALGTRRHNQSQLKVVRESQWASHKQSLSSLFMVWLGKIWRLRATCSSVN